MRKLLFFMLSLTLLQASAAGAGEFDQYRNTQAERTAQKMALRQDAAFNRNARGINGLMCRYMKGYYDYSTGRCTAAAIRGDTTCAMMGGKWTVLTNWPVNPLYGQHVCVFPGKGEAGDESSGEAFSPLPNVFTKTDGEGIYECNAWTHARDDCNQEQAGQCTERRFVHFLALHAPEAMQCVRKLAVLRSAALCQMFGGTWMVADPALVPGLLPYEGFCQLESNGLIPMCVKDVLSVTPMVPPCIAPIMAPPPPSYFNPPHSINNNNAGGEWNITANSDGTYTASNAALGKTVVFTPPPTKKGAYGSGSPGADSWSYKVTRDDSGGGKNATDYGNFNPNSNGGGGMGWNWQSGDNKPNWGASGNMPLPKSGQTGDTTNPTNPPPPSGSGQTGGTSNPTNPPPFIYHNIMLH